MLLFTFPMSLLYYISTLSLFVTTQLLFLLLLQSSLSLFSLCLSTRTITFVNRDHHQSDKYLGRQLQRIIIIHFHCENYNWAGGRNDGSVFKLLLHSNFWHSAWITEYVQRCRFSGTFLPSFRHPFSFLVLVYPSSNVLMNFGKYPTLLLFFLVQLGFVLEKRESLSLLQVSLLLQVIVWDYIACTLVFLAIVSIAKPPTILNTISVKTGTSFC